MTHLHPEDILKIYATLGHRCDGPDSVSHLSHAWQCGQLAFYAEASPAMQLACWLHDLGRLVCAEPQVGVPVDDWHEHLGADLLEPLWGEDVSGPVRLHVQAKRYLVTRHPDYCRRLPPASLATLPLQGGALSADECRAFESSRHHKAAVLLRVWDEQAQQPQWEPASRREALAQLEALMQEVPRLTGSCHQTTAALTHH